MGGIIFFFFFHWHYSPLWALACRKRSFNFFLSATNSLHLPTPSTWRSSSTSSFHLFLGLPFLLVPSSFFQVFTMICTFHVARVISVYLLSFRPSSFHLSSFFFCSTFVTISFFLLGGVLRPTPNPQPVPGYPFVSGSAPLTCLAWEALPVP